MADLPTNEYGTFDCDFRLHISLAMGIGFFFARFLQLALPTRFISPWFPLCFGVLIALGYAYLAGFSLPTFRAMMALLFIAILQFSRRYYTPSKMLCLVVAFLLFVIHLCHFRLAFGFQLVLLPA